MVYERAKLRSVSRENDAINELFRLLDVDFPMYARIPLVLLRTGLKRGFIKAVYLQQGKQVLGYAIFQLVPQLKAVHVLYLAVLPPYRSCGAGSLLLKKLNRLAAGRLVLEVEDPEFLRGKERTLAEKRIAFYHKNGLALLPGFRFVNFGFHMRVMMGFKAEQRDWMKQYRKMYNNAYILPISFFMLQKG